MIKIFSIIPARGGSKGIVKKNITILFGKPLIHYSINASLGTNEISKTIVSTDDLDITNKVLNYKIDLVERPNELADDKTTLLPVISHVFNVKPELKDFDYFILLQPTSPLRTSWHISEAISLLIKKEAISLISVVEAKKSPYKSFIIDKDGLLNGLIDNLYPFQSRQYLPPTYYPNGAIYIQNVKEFLNTNSLFSKKTIPYIMDVEDSIDIDTLDDLAIAENLIMGKK